MTPVLFCLFVALLGGLAFDLVIEPFKAAASMNAMSGTPEDWDSYGVNSSLTLTDSGQALQVNYTVEQAQSWGGAVIFDRPAQSQANFDCSRCDATRRSLAASLATVPVPAAACYLGTVSLLSTWSHPCF